MQANNRGERYAKIAEIKLRMPIEQICGNQAPLEFSNYMHYVRALRFEDRPDYAGIRLIFKKLMRKEGFEYDHMFDWIIIAPQPSTMINFTVESFDDIKSVNRKKPLTKEQTVGNETQPSLPINDDGNIKRTNEENK